MELERYVTGLRAQLTAAAGAGGADAQAMAERMSTALDPAVRLVLLEVLSDAAGEITRDLAPGSVDVRLRGRDPELIVSRPSAPPADAFAADAPVLAAPLPEPVDASEDGGTTRTTLRLPDHLKIRVERAAAAESLSVNSWLVRAVTAALEPRPRRAVQRESRGGDRFTGWVR